MPKIRSYAFPTRIALKGMTDTGPILYSTTIPIRFGVFPAIEVATCNIDEHRGRWNLKIFSANGTYYSRNGWRGLNAIQLLSTLDWSEEPAGGYPAHPFSSISHDFLGDGYPDFDLDGIAPPSWKTYAGGTHGERSSLYGGDRRADNVVSPTIDLGHPPTIEEHALNGITVIPGNEDEAALTLQEFTNRHLAIIGGMLMERTREPRIVISMSLEKKKREIKLVTLPKGSWPTPCNIGFEYPLHAGETALEHANAISARLSGSLVQPVVSEISRPDLLSQDFLLRNWMDTLPAFHHAVFNAAPFVPDTALSIGSGMHPDSTVPLSHEAFGEWMETWGKFNEALGDMAGSYAGAEAPIRRLHGLNEFIRYSFGGVGVPERKYKAPPVHADASHRELVKRTVVYLARGGKEFMAKWQAFRSAGGVDIVDTARALLENPPECFPNPGSLLTWNNQFIPELMRIARMDGARTKITEAKVMATKGYDFSFRAPHPILHSITLPSELAEEFGVTDLPSLVGLYDTAREAAGAPALHAGNYPSSIESLHHLAAMLRKPITGQAQGYEYIPVALR